MHNFSPHSTPAATFARGLIYKNELLPIWTLEKMRGFAKTNALRDLW